MMRIVLLAVTLMTTGVSAKKIFDKEARCDKNFAKGIEAVQDGKNSKGVQLLSNVRLECIGGLENPDSLYYFLGEAYRKGKKPEEARLEYRMVVEEYPYSLFREESAYKMALCSFKASPIKERDSKTIRRAMREFNTFIADFPESKWTDTATIYVDSIYARLIDKELANARYYEIVEQWDAAVIYYRSIMTEFPENKREDYIKLQIVKNLVNGYRFAEARDIMKGFSARNIYGDEIKSQESRITYLVAKQEKESKRRLRRAGTASDA